MESAQGALKIVLGDCRRDEPQAIVIGLFVYHSLDLALIHDNQKPLAKRHAADIK
jgi:hypothetical protein